MGDNQSAAKLQPDTAPRPLSDLGSNDQIAWAMVDASPDAIVVVNDDGIIELVNHQTEALFGYDRGELLGRSVEILVPPALAESHRRHRAQFHARPEVRALDSRTNLLARLADDTDIPVEISLSPLKINGHSLTIAAIRDISERVAAEEKIRASEARFRAAFGAGPVPMCIVEVQPPDVRTMIDVNAALADLFGYTRDELIGQPAAVLVHPDNVLPDSRRAQAIASGKPVDYEHVIRGVRKDGRELWLQRHVSALSPDTEGDKLIVHCVDITAEVEADLARRRQQDLTAALSATRLTMLQGASRTDGLTQLCEAAAKLLNATGAVVLTPTGSDDEVGIEASAGVPIEVQRQMAFSTSKGAVGQVFETGEPVRTDGQRHPDAPPRTQDILKEKRVGPVLMVPLPFGDGVGGVLTVVRLTGDEPFTDDDIDPLRQFAAGAVGAIELAQSSEHEAELELIADRERIGRDIHDNVISKLFATGMKIQATTVRAIDDEVKHRLIDAVDAIDDAIKDIRTAIYGVRSRTDWGRGVRGALLAIAADASDNLGFEPNVHFDGAIDELPQPIVDGLVAVIREALTNAAKYAYASNVQIDVCCTPASVKAEISDDGTGFAPDEDLSRTDLGGNGLGNIASRADSLGGHASVVSRPGAGTTITWTIPLHS